MPGRISSATFVGRRDHLASLHEAFTRARAGRPTTVVVGGEAGVGKTRLVTEFVDGVAEGTRVLQGGCLELGQAVLPFAPLVGILRQLSQQLGPDRTHDLYGAELARFLPEGGHATGAAEGSAGLFEAMAMLLRHLDESGPVVLVVEDLHWADRSTLDLLTYLSRNLGTTRVLLVATYRSDEMRRSHALRPVLAELSRLPDVQRLQLAPLDVAEVAELLTAIRGTPVSAELADQIADRAEGNPFFAEELLAVAGEGGVPPTLRDILGARLDVLPEQAKEVLRIAAAAGRRVDHRLLERVAELAPAELEAGLRAAVDHEALVPDSDGFGYRFRHALVQEAVHEQLLPGERTRLHAAFAAALEAEPDLAVAGAEGVHAELAHHALLAHDLELAFFSLVKAGRRARQLFAYAEAQQQFERAAELRPKVDEPDGADAPPVWLLLQNAAHCARYAADVRAAGAHLRRAIATLDPSRHAIEVGGLYGELSEALWLTGSSTDSVEASDRSIEVLTEQPTRERAEALGWRSRLMMLLGRYDEAIEPGREAVALARQLDAQVELCRALNSLGTSLVMVDEADEGLPLIRESIEVGRNAEAAPEVVRGYINIGSALTTPLDRLAEAEKYHRAALDYAVLFPASAAPVDWTRLELASVLLRLGRWDESEQAIHGVRFVAGGGVLAQYYHTSLATHRVLRGDFDEAAEHLRLAETETPDIRDPQAVVPLAELRLRLQLAGHGPDARELPTGLDLGEPDAVIFSVFALLARVEVEVALSDGLDTTRVDDLLARLTTLRRGVPDGGARASNLDYWIDLVAAERSRLSASDPALWQRALVAMRHRGHAEHEMYAQFRLAEALTDAGDTQRGGAELGEVHDQARRLGAKPLLEQIETLARRTRLKLPGLATSPGVDGLTAREREVLELVARGLTNRQIGEALFISEKTASVHLSNILGKLGVANRTEAAHAARALGLSPD